MARATVLLVAASALHLGFQLTVTALVYPALARVGVGDWAGAHVEHSRRIVPLVVLTYGLQLVTLVVAGLSGPRNGWLLLCGAGTALAFLTTALAAAPTHGRLGSGRRDALVTRLLRVDRLRTVGAAAAVVGALGLALT